MNAVREKQDEYFVVLKIDDLQTYENVNHAIEPLLQDEHVDLVELQPSPGNLLEGAAAKAGLDLMDDAQVELLVKTAPRGRRQEVRDAVALLRSIGQSLTDIGESHAEILANTRQMRSSIDDIRRKVRAATDSSKAKLAELGL